MLLMGGVLIQSIHSSHTSQILETLELFDHHDLDDLDKKEKEYKEKISLDTTPWNLADITSLRRDLFELSRLKYPSDFFDSLDNPPEFS